MVEGKTCKLAPQGSRQGVRNVWSVGSDVNIAAGRDTVVFTWLQVHAGWIWALKEVERAENSERKEEPENQHGCLANRATGVAGVKVCDAKRLLLLERILDIACSIPPSRNSQPEGTE